MIYDKVFNDTTDTLSFSVPGPAGTLRYQIDQTASYATAAAMDAAAGSAAIVGDEVGAVGQNSEVIDTSSLAVGTWYIHLVWNNGQDTVPASTAFTIAAVDNVGSAAGSALVLGVGASIAAAAGASNGVAVVAAVGSTGGSVNEGAGASVGIATVSGIGAATVAASGSSAGAATVSGVGTTAGGSFDPASLFGSGEAGFFFDFTTANCYTNTTRTTNATLSDTVAGVTDLSGNGNHASQSSTGSRPAMDETSSLQHVTFDGVDDRLDVTVNMTGVTSATLWAVISKDGDVDDGRVVGNDIGAGTFRLFAPNTSANLTYRLAASRTDNSFDRTATSASTYAAPDLAYLVGWHVGDNSTNPCVVLRRNGSQVGTNANTSVWSGLGSQTWRIGNQQFGQEDFQGKIYAVGLIGRILTSGELSDLEAWCATRGGI